MSLRRLAALELGPELRRRHATSASAAAVNAVLDHAEPGLGRLPAPGRPGSAQPSASAASIRALRRSPAALVRSPSATASSMVARARPSAAAVRAASVDAEVRGEGRSERPRSTRPRRGGRGLRLRRGGHLGRRRRVGAVARSSPRRRSMIVPPTSAADHEGAGETREPELRHRCGPLRCAAGAVASVVRTVPPGP